MGEKRKMRKIITILTILSVVLTIISIGLNFLIPIFISRRFGIDRDKASSIGIIGGADGPTSIFIAGMGRPYMFSAIFAALSILGFVYLYLTRN